MQTLAEAVGQVASASGFSGVVRIDEPGADPFTAAYGLADRAHDIPMSIDSQLAIASGSKAFTALVVMSLVEDGTLDLSTPARSVLGGDLPLIADDVTVEHLLGHRSGIGDYFAEDDDADIDDYALPVSVHRLSTTEAFLDLLAGYPTVFPAGERFEYCNGGYVVLALVAERISRTGFHELVRQRVCVPAGLHDTAFLRSDRLPGRAALGYVHLDDEWRTNVFHLPVRGSGDGGAYTTLADVHRFWNALFEGRIVSTDTLAAMTRPRSTLPSGSHRYGLGFWLDGFGSGVQLEGCDAGVSFRSHHDPVRRRTWTVIANTSAGAWPLAKALRTLDDETAGTVPASSPANTICPVADDDGPLEGVVPERST